MKRGFALILALLLAVPFARAEAVESREALLERLGALNPEDTQRVEYCEAARDGALLRLHIEFEENTYTGGTDGYMEQWLTGEGVAAEADVDLDGDGEDELLLLSCSTNGDPDSDWVETQWKGLVFEASGEGWTQAAEFPLALQTYGSCERDVRLVRHDGRTCVALVRHDLWDGGGEAVRATVFAYDGREVSVALLACAGVNNSSFAAVGPFSLEQLGQLDGYPWIDADIVEHKEALGLAEGENFWQYPFTETNPWDEDAGDVRLTVDPGALEGFEAVAGILAEYGIEADHQINNMPLEPGRVIERVSLSVKPAADALLWAKEDVTYLYENHIDVALRTQLDHGVTEAPYVPAAEALGSMGTLEDTPLYAEPGGDEIATLPGNRLLSVEEYWYAADGACWVRVTSRGQEGWAAAEALEDLSGDMEGTVCTALRDTTVYNGEVEDADALMELKAGTRVYVTGVDFMEDDANFVSFEIDHEVSGLGFAALEDFAFADEDLGLGRLMTVAEGGANLLEEPARASRRLGTLAAGVSLRVYTYQFARGEAWACISLDENVYQYVRVSELRVETLDD